jgi:hypothetical protein
MRLKPDDILQKGDLAHWKEMETIPLGDAWCDGKHNVQDFSRMVSDNFTFIERPDPVMSDAEKICILRETCKAVLSALESHQAYDKDMRPELRAALEATK